MEEILEIYDEIGRPMGTARRSIVHTTGLWHRAANVFLFSPSGALLIQQRHKRKDVCPGAWDLSVAEHLKAGETYEEAAVRGLREELGISGIRPEVLGAVYSARTIDTASGVFDFEFQQSFRAEFSGDIRPDPSEVIDTRWCELHELNSEIKRQPQMFTPWFRNSLSEVLNSDSVFPNRAAK